MGLTFIDKVQCSDSIRGAPSLLLEQQSNLKTSCSDSLLMEVHHWSVSANYFFATSRSHRTLQYACQACSWQRDNTPQTLADT